MGHTYNNQNIRHYFNYLSPKEQIKEIDDLIAYFSKDLNKRVNFRHNYSKMMSLKSIKKDIISRMNEYVIYSYTTKVIFSK